jgi:hypothetical protein
MQGVRHAVDAPLYRSPLQGQLRARLNPKLPVSTFNPHFFSLQPFGL